MDYARSSYAPRPVYGIQASPAYGAATPAYWSSPARTRLIEYTSIGGARPYSGGNTSPNGTFNAAAFAASLGKP